MHSFVRTIYSLDTKNKPDKEPKISIYNPELFDLLFHSKWKHKPNSVDFQNLQLWSSLRVFEHIPDFFMIM